MNDSVGTRARTSLKRVAKNSNLIRRCLAPAALAGLVLSLGGCIRTPLPKLDRSMPAHWRSATGAPARPPVDLHAWWKAFHDPLLDRLVDQALHDNPDVSIAREHLRAARALYGDRMAPLRPHLGLHTANPIDPDASASYFVIGFDSTWELGLFGRGQATDRIATGHYLDAVATLRAARVSLVAEVVRDLVRLRAAQRQVRLLGHIVEARRRQVALTRKRVQLKLSSEADLAKARAALASARADQAMPRMQAHAAAQQLALLLGRDAPDPAWLKPASLPKLGPHGPVAAPAELLRSRPGIARAEAQVVSAAGQLGIARADMYPRIGLGASMLWSANIASYKHNSGTNAIATVGPLIQIPLFDWGMRVSHKVAQGHLLKAAVLNYRKAVLTGVAEVETALGNLQQQRLREHAIEAACAAWNQAASAQQTRRHLGLSSDLDGADIRIARSRAQIELARARSDRDLAYIALYKALGGAPPLPARDDSVASARRSTH